MCSLAPLLILIIAITGIVYGEAATTERMAIQLRLAIGSAGGDALAMFIRNPQTRHADLATTIIGAAGLLFVASGLFNYVGSAYSIVGAVVIILAWVYYSALIFFFGAELTRLYANRFGSQIVPAPHALSLAAGDRAAQGLLRTAELEALAQQRETDT
jgi:uncharacterized BrkB/YihY/UPF0761 family membrane protein